MNLEGKIHLIQQTEQVSQSFQKRGIIIEYAENPLYPQFVQLEFIQDKCPLPDMFQVGQMVSIEFNLKGREWQSPSGEKKYFNTLQAWQIRALDANTQPVQQPQPQAIPTAPPVAIQQGLGEAMDDDDLPF